MKLKDIVQKFSHIRAMVAEASPAFPLILDSLRLQQNEYEVCHTASGLFFRLLPRSGDWFTFFECCIRQDYFPKQFELEQGCQVLDIGGNFGAFALMASKKVGSGGIVHCYEPSPKSAARIIDHVSQNGFGNIKIMQCAVGGVDGEISLYMNEKSALSTIKREVDGRMSTTLNEIKVNQISICEVLKAMNGRVALAKIDCEGAEYDIMDHIQPEDLSRIAMIVMETHRVPGRQRHEILSKLIENGFKIHDGNPFIAVNSSLY